MAWRPVAVAALAPSVSPPMAMALALPEIVLAPIAMPLTAPAWVVPPTAANELAATDRDAAGGRHRCNGGIADGNAAARQCTGVLAASGGARNAGICGARCAEAACADVEADDRFRRCREDQRRQSDRTERAERYGRAT